MSLSERFDLIDVAGRPYPVEAVIEALSPHLLETRIQRMEGVLATRLASVVLGVEDLHLTHNGAACLRTAEGLGLQDVVAAELRQPFPLPEDPMVEGAVPRRITMAAHQWIDLERVDTTAELMAWARERDMLIFGAGPRAALSLDELPIERPALLLFGNEAAGLRAGTLEACDDTFRIPMYGFTESFNVSVSVGMSLAAVTSRKRATLARDGRSGDLPLARQRHLLARWCLSDLRAAAAIVQRKLG